MTPGHVVFRVEGHADCLNCRWIQFFRASATDDKGERVSGAEISTAVGRPVPFDMWCIDSYGDDPWYPTIAVGETSKALVDIPGGMKGKMTETGKISVVHSLAQWAAIERGQKPEDVSNIVTVSQYVMDFQTFLVCEIPNAKPPRNYRPVYVAEWMTEWRRQWGLWIRLPAHGDGRKSDKLPPEFSGKWPAQFMPVERGGKRQWEVFSTIDNVVSEDFVTKN